MSSVAALNYSQKQTPCLMYTWNLKTKGSVAKAAA